MSLCLAAGVAGVQAGDAGVNRRPSTLMLLICESGAGQGPVVRGFLAARRGGPESMSRWSARSAARTNDLDVDEDRRKLIDRKAAG
jgi:hypothetical protein